MVGCAVLQSVLSSLCKENWYYSTAATATITTVVLEDLLE